MLELLIPLLVGIAISNVVAVALAVLLAPRYSPTAVVRFLLRGMQLPSLLALLGVPILLGRIWISFAAVGTTLCVGTILVAGWLQLHALRVIIEAEARRHVAKAPIATPPG